MSYEEKGQWAYLAVTVLVFGAYAILVGGRVLSLPLTEVPYVTMLLWAVGLAIFLTIVARVSIEIVRPSESRELDVRDEDIGRHGEYVGGLVLALGMLVPFGLTLAGFAHFWIANAMYLAYVASAVVGTAVKLVAYRRGL